MVTYDNLGALGHAIGYEMDTQREESGRFVALAAHHPPTRASYRLVHEHNLRVIEDITC